MSDSLDDRWSACCFDLEQAHAEYLDSEGSQADQLLKACAEKDRELVEIAGSVTAKGVTSKGEAITSIKIATDICNRPYLDSLKSPWLGRLLAAVTDWLVQRT